ncbi:phosphoethanolamine transferase [Phascolarctobacterium sp.]|uniref:phosphoethanolamine transferase n=1 Tax=Phascolarctobacterium sp. TaxID=2049039 RepID=UPI0025DD2FC1|nr:phosphoethanolamine transferase [Phascolarctobacterium sp.]
MSTYSTYLITALVLYLFSYIYYLKISHGLGNKATYLQMRRFVPCAILAVLPAALASLPLFSPLFIIPAVIAVLWILTYPTLYFISNHKVSSDFEFHFEAVMGLYFIAWISSLGILAQQVSWLAIPATIFITLAELLMLAIPVAQLIYYGLYKACINENGMEMIQETHYNEIIEYIKSMPLMLNISVLFSSIIIILATIISNYKTTSTPNLIDNISLTIITAIVIFLSTYLWKKKHGVFIRTAIVEFYLDVKEYLATNLQYTKNMQDRISKLQVTSLNKSQKPQTILLVIGESASRDYMKAFNKNYKYDTTPWLNQMAQRKNCILFPNAFSILPGTVIAVSNAMTEINQYNDKKFYESCSIIDIAHKAGYKVHWYSNQGHLGSADTPVTLIANTADVAKWTKQELNQIQYDESLLDYLGELDAKKNNFLVVHLKGSHFNFLNRYPESFTKFGTPGKYELELNYANSIAYTDSVLEQIFNYAKDNLNLQAMVYFSDHATVPDKRRSPNFEGLASVRIPFFTYFADEYIAQHQEVYDTLKKHENFYWTNDLAYELLCSIFDIKSNHFDEANSLASEKFKYKREDLRTNCGQSKI